MRTRAMRRVTARYTWDQIRVGFWFVPALAAIAGTLLAWGVAWLDIRVPNAALENLHLIVTGNAGEDRVGLFAIATAVLTTAGIVFTLLTLPLSTVATQYGSRLLRVYQSDRTTQAVLGMFVLTFVYCIAAAGAIPPPSAQPEAPQFTISVALLLMLGSFASLVLLVHHISSALQAPSIAAAAAEEMFDVLRSVGPDDKDAANKNDLANPDVPHPDPKAEGFSLRVQGTGYIQLVDPEYLLTLAKEQDLFFHLLKRPGQFVTKGDVVAQVWPASRIDDRLDGYLRRAFRVGNQRTPTQDIECAVNQLVEMAVRAMSPAINDPFTAITCLDYLGAGLALFAKQGEEFTSHYDRAGRLRLVLDPVGFDEMLDAAFNMLRHAGCDNAKVLLHMLDAIDVIRQDAQSARAQQALARHVSLIMAEGEAGKLIAQDRSLIQQRGRALLADLSLAT